MPALSVQNIKKSYESTLAAADISFAIDAGKVLAVCGENGAGKSTLMKVLSGAILPDSGGIWLDGGLIDIAEPSDAMALGIRTVYQELSLLPHISVAENMLMGRMPTRGFGLAFDWPAANTKAGQVLADLGFPNINPRILVQDLSVAQQQIVEIAKALVTDPRILILDEPSAVLSASETEKLFSCVRDLAKNGVTILYISHRLEEIFEIADEVVVLKDGRSIVQGPVDDFTPAQLIEAMVGRPLEAIYPERNREAGNVVLETRHLTKSDAFEDISLQLHAGEIVGMFGLVGSGRTEVASAIFGAQPADSGTILLDGQDINFSSPEHAVNRGMAMITEDRKGNGLALDASIQDNASLASFKRISNLGVIDSAERRRLVDEKVRELSIRSASTSQAVRQLSGGNQQKVVIAKWLLVENTKVFLFDEPTRGVDIATKVEIYQMIADLAASGVAVLLISSELPEVVGLSDRLLIMRDGKLVAELTENDFEPEIIFAHAAGFTEPNNKVAVH